MSRGKPKSIIHVLEAVEAACPVKLKIYIHHLALCTVKAKPFTALGNSCTEFNKGIRFSCL